MSIISRCYAMMSVLSCAYMLGLVGVTDFYFGSAIVYAVFSREYRGH